MCGGGFDGSSVDYVCCVSRVSWCGGIRVRCSWTARAESGLASAIAYCGQWQLRSRSLHHRSGVTSFKPPFLLSLKDIYQKLKT